MNQPEHLFNPLSPEYIYKEEDEKAEIECEIWHLANEMGITWDEAIKVWRELQEIPFSDEPDYEPF